MILKSKSENSEYKLNVYIRSRSTVFVKSECYSVTSINDKGEFDILPLHANFITLVKKHVIVDKNLPSEKKIELDSGVLNAQGNNVDIYVGI